MPGYPAARAFAEMRAAAPGSILHLVHPRATPWRTLLAPIANALGVPLVPYAQWLAALERARGPRAVRLEVRRERVAVPALRREQPRPRAEDARRRHAREDRALEQVRDAPLQPLIGGPDLRRRLARG